MKKLDLIHQEASQLFARYGYDGVSMRDVAEACGITLATLYYHFSSKEALHDEVMQFRFEAFIGALARRRQRMTAAEDRPSVLLQDILDAVLHDQTLFNLMQHELHHLDDDLRRIHTRKRTDAFIALIQHTLEKHWERPALDTDVFAMAALITGYCELIQADDSFTTPQRDAFVQRQRAALVALAQRHFDRPSA
ncbi:MAG TPA: helix-turn-helix domain-containing protein [Macromonas sp.]|nr:helix-turn-helix domain-containing protein [Macromonas sp.]